EGEAGRHRRIYGIAPGLEHAEPGLARESLGSDDHIASGNLGDKTRAQVNEGRRDGRVFGGR
ncbi:MAG: hypothetical protein ISP97_07275, partial [Luminiphilus sp.]|nr:hypothetical protein [Luminiphilus sp.]